MRNLLRISGAWSAFTGEAPPVAPAVDAQEARKKATVAGSVTEPAAEPEAADEAPPAEVPEAEDQASAAPEADPEETTRS